MENNTLFLNRKQQLVLYIQVITLFSCAMSSTSASIAKKYQLNSDWSLESNNSFSLGVNWSTADASSLLVYRPDAYSIDKIGSSIDVNGDDGRVNFNRHDVISQVFKGYSELRLNGQQQGAVLSVKYWYDHAYETGEGDLTAFNDRYWPKLAKFKGIDLWDAYLWQDIPIFEGNITHLTFGKHTLNWGKSLFFQNGLNSVSSFDFAGINRPGGDPKERIIPVEMFSFSSKLTENLTFEGFYQFKFRPSVVDGCGTFFAISDFVPENCGPIILTILPGDKLSDSALKNQTFIPRTESQYAKNSGQYGFSLKHNLPLWPDTEIGLYFANYHSRNAHFDGIAVQTPGPAHFQTATYFSIYPENIKMYGLSLSRKIATKHIFTELSHKPNQPLQLNGTDIVYAQVLDKNSPLKPPGVAAELNEYLQGYVRLPVTQFSIGISDSLNDILAAQRLQWVAEFGLNHIAHIGNHRFGRIGAFGRTELSSGAYDPVTRANQCIPNGTAHLSQDEIDQLNSRFCNRDGTFTPWSAGYRLRATLLYQDILAKTVLSPSLLFRHDLYGYSQNFQKGQMGVTASLAMTYDKKYTAELGYTNFFGHNTFSLLDDRDFVSLTFKANF
ncbi:MULTISPECIES: DUF1302 domain-containing protein [unclassified Acinetobacter]|uniref:DUF1302 domain-containing protein n=1 Tax=unclassified Acinetobacter TaxID=196816 RepID=UPI0029345A2F|nr:MULTISPECIES: DUF1302 domain-containing protein [unclassified Acinetobacter]WOE30492.1 DUF1302 domain-containing protein [Acinetobacter sp. SAAs470]WOE38683.1 DUF1302 domain-containing protein [Acinetobacter sp. SAAs474]